MSIAAVQNLSMQVDLDLADLAHRRTARVEQRALMIASQVRDGSCVTLGEEDDAVAYSVTTARGQISPELGNTPVVEPDVPVLVREAMIDGVWTATSLVDLARDIPVWDEYKVIANLLPEDGLPAVLQRPTEVDIEEAALELDRVEALFIEVIEAQGRREITPLDAFRRGPEGHDGVDFA